MKSAFFTGAALLLVAAAACSSFDAGEVPPLEEAGPAGADGSSTDGTAQDGSDAASEVLPPIPSPCADSDAGHWLCDDFDRPSTPALPPQWTNVEELSGGALVLDDERSRSAPKALVATTSGGQSQAILHADKMGPLSALRCGFDLFVDASGPADGRVRVAQLELRRPSGEHVIGHLKINEGSLVLEHGGLVTTDAGPAIIPSVTFDPVGNGWHHVAMTLRGTSYDVSVDGRSTTATFPAGSTLPFSEARLTFGLVALATSDAWKIAIDNIVCDAL